MGICTVALANERIAHQSGGVFYLRIEDTDEKRKVEGAVEVVHKSLKYFGVNFDEGAVNAANTVRIISGSAPKSTARSPKT